MGVLSERCWCRCHVQALAQAAIARENAKIPGMQSELVKHYMEEAAYDPGADVEDVIEAAVACAKCLNRHTPALREKRIWGPRIRVPVPQSDGDQGEGAE